MVIEFPKEQNLRELIPITTESLPLISCYYFFARLKCQPSNSNYLSTLTRAQTLMGPKGQYCNRAFEHHVGNLAILKVGIKSKKWQNVQPIQNNHQHNKICSFLFCGEGTKKPQCKSFWYYYVQLWEREGEFLTYWTHVMPA